jgi:hypothetical protein
MAVMHLDTDGLDDIIAAIADLADNPVTDSSHRHPPTRAPRRTVPAVPCFACQKPITGELWVQPEHKVNKHEWEPTYFCKTCAHIPVPSKHGGTRTIAGGGPGVRCEWCGRVFHARAHWRVYCTPECRQAVASRSYYETHRQVALTSHTCEVCDRSFTPSRSDAKTCSSACRQKAYRSRR